jgi:hypothetical protein
MNHAVSGVNAGYITRSKLLSDHLRQQQEMISRRMVGGFRDRTNGKAARPVTWPLLPARTVVKDVLRSVEAERVKSETWRGGPSRQGRRERTSARRSGAGELGSATVPIVAENSKVSSWTSLKRSLPNRPNERKRTLLRELVTHGSERRSATRRG